MGLVLHPLTIQEAKVLVSRWHRHHLPPLSGLFAIGVSRAGEEEPCGAAIVGRPVARVLQDGWTAEVTRLVTDGTLNACSMLYGACWRAARALGYRRLVTYTLPEEGGRAFGPPAGAASGRLAAGAGVARADRGWICTRCR